MTTELDDAKPMSLHFSIRGGDMTRIVRDRVLEGDPDHALRMLMKCVPDLTLRQAEEILNGTTRFSGVNSFTLVPDKAKRTQKYQAEVAELYAGRIRKDDRWWEPYAWVGGGLSAADVDFARRVRNRWLGCANMSVPVDMPTAYSVARMREWGRARCLRYMEDPLLDRAEIGRVVPTDPQDSRESVPAWVLWRECPHGRPPWLDPYRDWEDAAFDASKRGHLVIVGAFVSPWREDEVNPDDPPPGTGPAPYGGRSVPYPAAPPEPGVDAMPAGVALELALEAAAADEAVREQGNTGGYSESLLDTLGVDEELRGLFRKAPDKVAPGDRTSKRGWCSPEGEVFECEYGQHEKIAPLLAPHVPDHQAQETLENSGWIKFSVGGPGGQGWVHVRRHPTDAQRVFVIEWAAANDVALSALPREIMQTYERNEDDGGE